MYQEAIAPIDVSSVDVLIAHQIHIRDTHLSSPLPSPWQVKMLWTRLSDLEASHKSQQLSTAGRRRSLSHSEH